MRDYAQSDIYEVSDKRRQDLTKVMDMIYRKDSKGNYLVEDLVRENAQWETNQRCMRSIFGLVQKPKYFKDPEEQKLRRNVPSDISVNNSSSK